MFLPHAVKDNASTLRSQGQGQGQGQGHDFPSLESIAVLRLTTTPSTDVNHDWLHRVHSSSHPSTSTFNQSTTSHS